MKTKFFLTLTMVCLLLACNSDQPSTQKTDSDKLEIIPLTHSLFPNDNHYTIKIGQQMEYVFESSRSAGGKDFSCYIISANVLSFIGRVPIQEEPELDTPKDKGSDKTEKFLFEGAKEGTSTLVICKFFKYKVQKKMVFTITVEK